MKTTEEDSMMVETQSLEAGLLASNAHRGSLSQRMPGTLAAVEAKGNEMDSTNASQREIQSFMTLDVSSLEQFQDRWLPNL